jgi:hypothetical protein
MARVSRAATERVLGLLSQPSGVNAAVAALQEEEQATLGAIGDRQIVAQNVSPDLAERSLPTAYPVLTIWCERLNNLLIEKFRVFSGKAHLAIEVRVSQDRLEGLEKRLQLYTEAVLRVLDQNRGDWGEGLFYTGGYDAAFGPVKHGGKNFLQTAKITFQVGVSTN